MGRVAVDTTLLLPVLVAARKTVKAGQTVGGNRLAELSGTTWRVLKSRIALDKEFPVASRGANGVSWSFDAATALDYMIARAKAQGAQRQRQRSDSARLAGLEQGDAGEAKRGRGAKGKSPTAPESASDMAADARALKAIAETQMLVHRLKVEQGKYLPADAVRTMLDDVMTTFQVETLAIASRLDKAGAWPAGLRTSVDGELRSVLLHVQAKIEGLIGKRG